VIIELWLLWALVHGQPADVDSFLSKEACEESLLQGNARLEQNRAAAKAGNAPPAVMDKLNSMTFYGCTPARAELKQGVS
jgi:hypothetical protein